MEESRMRRLMACLLVNRDDVLHAMDDNWLKKYHYLQEHLYKTNVATDVNYRWKYRKFYRLRGIDVPLYFRILQREKLNLSVCFDDVLRELYKGRVELSFASKLVATVNPDKPVYDSHVDEFFAAHGIRFSTYHGKKMEKKLEKAIENYRLLVDTTRVLVENPGFANLRDSFDKRFHDFRDFTDIKKLDAYMWWSAQES